MISKIFKLHRGKRDLFRFVHFPFSEGSTSSNSHHQSQQLKEQNQHSSNLKNQKQQSSPHTQQSQARIKATRLSIAKIVQAKLKNNYCSQFQWQKQIEEISKYLQKLGFVIKKIPELQGRLEFYRPQITKKAPKQNDSKKDETTIDSHLQLKIFTTVQASQQFEFDNDTDQYLNDENHYTRMIQIIKQALSLKQRKKNNKTFQFKLSLKQRKDNTKNKNNENFQMILKIILMDARINEMNRNIKKKFKTFLQDTIFQYYQSQTQNNSSRYSQRLDQILNITNIKSRKKFFKNLLSWIQSNKSILQQISQTQNKKNAIQQLKYWIQKKIQKEKYFENNFENTFRQITIYARNKIAVINHPNYINKWIKIELIVQNYSRLHIYKISLIQDIQNEKLCRSQQVSKYQGVLGKKLKYQFHQSIKEWLQQEGFAKIMQPIFRYTRVHENINKKNWLQNLLLICKQE